MRLAALGLALLLTTACTSDESEERPAAPGLTVHIGLSAAERGSEAESDLVEPGEESVIEADGGLLRIGPAVLTASEYASAGVSVDGVEVAPRW